MNYYKASELKGENGEGLGIFHFTRTNGNNQTYPLGYCRENKDSSYMCRHSSAIEASDCYRDYCRDRQNGIMAGFLDKSIRGTELTFTSSY